MKLHHVKWLLKFGRTQTSMLHLPRRLETWLRRKHLRMYAVQKCLLS
jgi:hypothetical protein